MGYQQASNNHQNIQKYGESAFEAIMKNKKIPCRPTTKEEQVEFGDYFIGSKTSVDVKCEHRWTGFSLLETWSNKKSPFRPGWAFSLKADLIADVFVDKCLMLIDWKKAKAKWNIQGDEPTRDWINKMTDTYRIESPEYNEKQYNQTEFLLIPIKDWEDVTVANYVYDPTTNWRKVDKDEWKVYVGAWNAEAKRK